MIEHMKRKIIIVAILFFLHLLGVGFAKYFIFIYIAILFLSIDLCSFCVLIYILLLPFIIYSKNYVLAESFAYGAFVFLGGGIINYISEGRIKFLEPAFSKQSRIFVIIGMFIFLTFSGILHQISLGLSL